MEILDLSLRAISALYYLVRELNPYELLTNNKEIRDSIWILPETTIKKIQNDKNEFEKIKAVFRKLDQQTLTKLEKMMFILKAVIKGSGSLGILNQMLPNVLYFQLIQLEAG